MWVSVDLIISLCLQIRVHSVCSNYDLKSLNENTVCTLSIHKHVDDLHEFTTAETNGLRVSLAHTDQYSLTVLALIRHHIGLAMGLYEVV